MTKKATENDALFLKCDCSTHLLEVSREKEETSINVAIWALGHEGAALPLLFRFRWIWRILWTGNPWGDSVILDLDKAKQLTNFLRRVVYKK